MAIWPNIQPATCCYAVYAVTVHGLLLFTVSITGLFFFLMIHAIVWCSKSTQYILDILRYDIVV